MDKISSMKFSGKMFRSWIIRLICANCCLILSGKQFSTVRTRITTDGLEFFSNIGHHIVDYEIWKITFPQITLPIHDGFVTGEVNVTELIVRAFKSPKFSMNLKPPNGIIWHCRDGFIKLDGNWRAVYYLIAPVSSI